MTGPKARLRGRLQGGPMPIVISDAHDGSDSVRVHNTDTNTHEDVPRNADAIRDAYVRAQETRDEE